jgi:hypothetical protein
MTTDTLKTNFAGAASGVVLQHKPYKRDKLTPRCYFSIKIDRIPDAFPYPTFSILILMKNEKCKKHLSYVVVCVLEIDLS